MIHYNLSFRSGSVFHQVLLRSAEGWNIGLQ